MISVKKKNEQAIEIIPRYFSLLSGLMLSSWAKFSGIIIGNIGFNVFSHKNNVQIFELSRCCWHIGKKKNYLTGIKHQSNIQ